MSKTKPVWIDGVGDVRKKVVPTSFSEKSPKVCEVFVRRLTSGKGRTVIEITNLPLDKVWCKDLAKKIKQKLGVGGTYKNNSIEIHGEKLDLVTDFFDRQNLKWKKIGG